MENDFRKQLKIMLAYKRVEQLKNFYVHLAAYCTVNISLLIYWYFESFMPETFWRTTFFITTVISGFIVLAHSIIVFGTKHVFSKNWEEKKFKKLIDKEKHLTRYE
ncbi:2TM domain-containing protein [Flavobacterium sp. NRK1]|uniref:2TM domain-containing protein n=1 Tax=Flavobacterium sp. NRK1 TaxID=2954929 RepID=UPI0020926DE0|nr:2TM domain-containing protein [Flavobacterium sp. NRK1]MCO6148585.1 2TM domain-containing protein [Flavobacterium sp. NRK1]